MLRCALVSAPLSERQAGAGRLQFDVEPGELVVVLGGNGSGKTTLLHCIARTLRPSAGEIWLGDTDLCALEGETAAARAARACDDLAASSLIRRRSVLTNVATGTLGRHFTWRRSAACRACRTGCGARAISCKSASTIWPRSAPARCPAARRSASQSRVRWRRSRACCWPTSRSRASIRKPRRDHAPVAPSRTEDNLAVLCVLHQVELAYAYGTGRRYSRRRRRFRQATR